MTRLVIRLQSAAQRAALETAARLAGEPLATWARRVLLDAAGGPPVDEERLARGQGLARGDSDAARAAQLRSRGHKGDD